MIGVSTQLEGGAEERVEEQAGERTNVDTTAHIGEAPSSAQMPDLVSRFSRDIEEVKKNQKLIAGQLSKVEKRQKGLKKFLIDCFTKLGGKARHSISSLWLL